MRRARSRGVAGAIALLALAAGAQADHDRAHPFAGNWTIDPTGNPGQLTLSRVSDDAGKAAIASFGSTLACAEPSDHYSGRLATPTDRGPLAGCTSTSGAADRLDGVYLSEAFAPAGPPAELDILVEHLAGGPQATAFVTTPGDPATVRQAPLQFDSHFAADGARLEPLVTLRLRVTGTRASGGATVTIKGTFRGRAVAGGRTYRLRPVGGAIATHRHGTAAAQRARVERVFLDVRSGSEYLRVTGSGSLIGGPVIDGPRGACRRIAFRYTVRPKAGTAVLRWACRRAGADRAPPIHLDVFTRPGDTIVSSYTIIRRPCSRRLASVPSSMAPAQRGAKVSSHCRVA